MINSIEMTWIALLHDIGKLISRTGIKEDHAILSEQLVREKLPDSESRKIVLECLKNHHWETLEKSELPPEHPAYILYEANNIAIGKDSCSSENGLDEVFNIKEPLRSIFNVVGKKEELTGYGVNPFFNQSIYPEKLEARLIDSLKENDYKKIFNSFEKKLSAESLFNPNLLLKLLESTTVYIPSSIHQNDTHDISFFDHSKLTAAISACLLEKLTEDEKFDFKTVCFTEKEISRQEKLFLMVSGDVSGIQDFIYTVAGKGALKSLRGRSFFIEIFVESFIDDFLEHMGLTRANLLYNGGGHFYLLLPNTNKAKELIKTSRENINNKLLNSYGLNMYMELRGESCSANELGNQLSEVKKNQSLTGEVYNRVNAKLAEGKIKRYTQENLKVLFNPNSSINRHQDGERECVVCKTSSSTIKPFKTNEADQESGELLICDGCKSFYTLGDKLVRSYKPDRQESYCVELNRVYEDGVRIPSLFEEDYFLHIQKAENNQSNTVFKKSRKYAINNFMLQNPDTTHLWIGNYNAKPDNENFLMDFKTLAQRSMGLKRIGVLRADVDNLGTLFINGFDNPECPENQWQYANIARYATLSREMSLYFKNTINELCQGITPFDKITILPGKNQAIKPRNLVIVYAGGDDVFIVGAWDEVIEFSLDFRKAFKLFTNDKLTFSAGLGIYPPSYPVGLMAQDTGVLESLAKEHPDKDAILIFGGIDDETKKKNCFSWDDFENKIINEKLKKLDNWFDYSEKNDEQNNTSSKLMVGKGFLYQLLELIRNMENNEINIARIAYAIARKEPSEKACREQKECYADFRKELYSWVQSPEEIRELITAITIFVYLHRKEKGENNEN